MTCTSPIDSATRCKSCTDFCGKWVSSTMTLDPSRSSLSSISSWIRWTMSSFRRKGIVSGLYFGHQRQEFRERGQYLGRLAGTYDLDESLARHTVLGVVQSHVPGMLDLDPAELGIDDHVPFLLQRGHGLER